MQHEAPDRQHTQRARRYLTVLGGGFVVLALSLGIVRSLDASVYAVCGCAIAGVLLLWVARFANDRWVRWFETLTSGWP